MLYLLLLTLTPVNMVVSLDGYIYIYIYVS